jgi:hypothetical protein
LKYLYLLYKKFLLDDKNKPIAIISTVGAESHNLGIKIVGKLSIIRVSVHQHLLRLKNILLILMIN